MELSVRNLIKKYGKNVAINDFSYVFTNGVYGLLGPNGAGKSTLINIITQNLKPDSGYVEYEGKDIFRLDKEYRKLLGFMPQQQGVYPEFTLDRFLFYMAALKGINKADAVKDIENIKKRVNLENEGNKKLGSFSGGMKQRALLAQAMLGDPKIIILDEPTAGLDPKERIRIRNLIAEIAFEKILIVATHVVPDVEFIAKNVLLLRKGKIVDSGKPAEICGKIKDKVFTVRTDEKNLEDIRSRYRICNISEDGTDILVRLLSDEIPSEYEAQACRPGLEDLYLYYFDDSEGLKI